MAQTAFSTTDFLKQVNAHLDRMIRDGQITRMRGERQAGESVKAVRLRVIANYLISNRCANPMVMDVEGIGRIEHGLQHAIHASNTAVAKLKASPQSNDVRERIAEKKKESAPYEHLLQAIEQFKTDRGVVTEAFVPPVVKRKTAVPAAAQRSLAAQTRTAAALPPLSAPIPTSMVVDMSGAFPSVAAASAPVVPFTTKAAPAEPRVPAVLPPGVVIRLPAQNVTPPDPAAQLVKLRDRYARVWNAVASQCRTARIKNPALTLFGVTSDCPLHGMKQKGFNAKMAEGEATALNFGLLAPHGGNATDAQREMAQLFDQMKELHGEYHAILVDQTVARRVS